MELLNQVPTLENTEVVEASKEEEGLGLIPLAYIFLRISGYFLPSIAS